MRPTLLVLLSLVAPVVGFVIIGVTAPLSYDLVDQGWGRQTALLPLLLVLFMPVAQLALLAATESIAARVLMAAPAVLSWPLYLAFLAAISWTHH